MRILGIETSCDETAASVVEDGSRVLSSVVASSLKDHARYGGIIPEIASRAQLDSISEVVEEACFEARLTRKGLDALAVTQGPGLIGSLLVGISFARALSASWGLPLVGVNHLLGHLYAAFIGRPLVFPFVGLVVSGGHTSLYRVSGLGREVVIASTRDDAAGEAFDKVGKILGLGYPGGPAIEALARKGSARAYPFRCDCGAGCDFSFSGIKTAVLYKSQQLKKMYGVISAKTRADLAASFQSAVIEDIVAKALRALEVSRSKVLAVGGGVAFNEALRCRLADETARVGVELRISAKPYCLDNAAMIASYAGRLMAAGKTKSRSHPAFAENPGLARG